MDSLSTKTSIRMLKRALENLSSDLSVLYNDALLRIESQNQDYRELAEKTLRWVAYTYRRFPVRALQEALAIDPDETDFDDEAMTPVGLILDVCAGLLILDEEDEIVRLVHYTAQDYFDMVQTTRFDNVHATIACDCVSYLSYEYFQHSEESSGDILTSSTKFCLLWYASGFWAQHAIMANRDARLSTKIHQFLVGNPRVMLEKSWDYTWYPWRMLTVWLRPHQSLEIAASLGLCHELEGYLKDTGKAGALTDDLNLLHLAADNDQASAIQVLLDHGADIERRDFQGLTPLHRALFAEALKAATALVNRGADVMAVTTETGCSMDPKHTPIAFVNANPPAPFLELLLGAGARIQTRDIFDETQLMQSLIRWNDVQTAKRLFEQFSVEHPTEKDVNSPALHWASYAGATKMVDMLLKYGADINSNDRYGQKALNMAFKGRKIDTVNLLLARGPDINAPGFFGMTPLHYAAKGVDRDCLLAVLRSGADVNRQDESQETALHMASKDGKPANLEVLLAQGANTEARDFSGKTSLIFAVEKGHEDCVLTLLRNGADANAQDEFGVTALHIASIAGSLTMTHELCEHHATVGTRSSPVLTLKYPTDFKGSYLLRSVLEDFKILYEFKIHGDPEVHIRMLKASLLDNLGALRHLLSIRKRLLDIRVWKEGVTALDFAVLGQHDEIIRLLESSTESATESDSVAFEEYLFDLLGVSSVEKAEEELK